MKKVIYKVRYSINAGFKVSEEEMRMRLTPENKEVEAANNLSDMYPENMNPQVVDIIEI